MAISFIGVGAQVAGNTATPITPPLPSGWQADDLAVLVVVGRPISDSTTAPGPASGWDQRAFRWFDWPGSTVDLAVVVWTRKLQSGDTAPDITLSGGWDDGGSAVGAASIAVYRGVDTTTPMDATPVTGESGSTQTTWTPPSITTATADAWVLSIVGSGDNNELTLNTANGFTTRMSGPDYDTTTGGDVAAGLADYELSTAGAATMPVWEQAAVGPDYWVGATLALRPAGGAATVNAVAAASWGNWSATGSATVTHLAVATASWGGWSATATAAKTVNATAEGSWGGWTAEASATVSHDATAEGSWGGWTGDASATVEHPATAEGSWGGWSATAAAEVTNDVLATAAGDWGAWTATGSAAVEHSALAAASWGGWTAEASAIVTKKATAAATWGGWTAEAAATVSHDATAAGTWGGWSAEASAGVVHSATAAGTWQGWVATASALAAAPVGTAQFASGRLRRRYAATATARRYASTATTRRFGHQRPRRSP